MPLLLSLGALVLAFGFGSFPAHAQPVAKDTKGWEATHESPNGDAHHGKQIAAAKCETCHGADGNNTNPLFPKLAGQNPDYLYSQLWAFHSGDRRSDTMSAMAADITGRDAADLASYFSEQKRRPDTVGNKALAATGERIFFEGAGSWMMSRCAMCHGSSGQRGMMGGRMMGHGMMGMGNGMMSRVPDLNGQHAAYIVDQLNHFATGQRQGTVMNRIAVSLSEADRRAVAEYLSGLH